MSSDVATTPPDSVLHEQQTTVADEVSSFSSSDRDRCNASQPSTGKPYDIETNLDQNPTSSTTAAITPEEVPRRLHSQQLQQVHHQHQRSHSSSSDTAGKGKKDRSGPQLRQYGLTKSSSDLTYPPSETSSKRSMSTDNTADSSSGGGSRKVSVKSPSFPAPTAATHHLKSLSQVFLSDILGKPQTVQQQHTKKDGQQTTGNERDGGSGIYSLQQQQSQTDINKDRKVYIKVIEAKDLPSAKTRSQWRKKQQGLMKKSSAFLMEVSSPNLMVVEKVTADCYVTVRLDTPTRHTKTSISASASASEGNNFFRTRTIPQKLNPFWCEEFTMDIPPTATTATSSPSSSSSSSSSSSFSSSHVGPVLKITVWDANKYDADEIIGRVCVPISSLDNSSSSSREKAATNTAGTNEVEQWFPLFPVVASVLPSHNNNNNSSNTTNNESDMSKRKVKKSSRVEQQEDKLRSVAATNSSSSSSSNTGGIDNAAVSPPRERKKQPTPKQQWLLTPDQVAGGLKYMLQQQQQQQQQLESGKDNKEVPQQQQQQQPLLPASFNLGSIRIKLKYTEEVILPLPQYAPLIQAVTGDPLLRVVSCLGHMTSEREAVAAVLLRVFHGSLSTSGMLWLVKWLISYEIAHTTNPEIIFRGNSLVTKTVDVFMKLTGMEYLKHTMQPIIHKLYYSKKSCEINPSKLNKGEDPKKNLKHLLYWVNALADAIFSSDKNAPWEFREIFHHIQRTVKEAYGENQAAVTRYTAVSGFLFLRFFCPAIMAPKLFHLMQEHAGVQTQRSLILIAKVLQNVANLVEFAPAATPASSSSLAVTLTATLPGAHQHNADAAAAAAASHQVSASLSSSITVAKEDYMSCLNPFVSQNIPRLKSYIDAVSSHNNNNSNGSTNTETEPMTDNLSSKLIHHVAVVPHDNMSPYNFDKELASLHRHLKKNWSSMQQSPSSLSTTHSPGDSSPMKVTWPSPPCSEDGIIKHILWEHCQEGKHEDEDEDNNDDEKEEEVAQRRPMEGRDSATGTEIPPSGATTTELVKRLGKILKRLDDAELKERKKFSKASSLPSSSSSSSLSGMLSF